MNETPLFGGKSAFYCVHCKHCTTIAKEEKKGREIGWSAYNKTLFCIRFIGKDANLTFEEGVHHGHSCQYWEG